MHGGNHFRNLFRISFLIAGHTKFNPDLLFSRIAKTYNRCDVFSTIELKNDIIANYADVTENDGSIVGVWREPLSTKYSKLQGIRSLHDFVFSKHCLTGEVIPRVRAVLYRSFQPSTDPYPDPYLSWKGSFKQCHSWWGTIIHKAEQKTGSFRVQNGTLDTNVPEFHSFWTLATISLILPCSNIDNNYVYY